MRRSPGEYVVLASLAGSLAFWGYLVFSGSWRFEGNELVAITLILFALALGVLAFWLLIRKRMEGAVLSTVFYGIQVLNVTLPSGGFVGFNSLPTLYFRLYGEADAPINLNIVSLILFVVALLLWMNYPNGRKVELGSPPNTSLERTREE